MAKRPPSFSAGPPAPRKWAVTTDPAITKARYGWAWQKLRKQVLQRDRSLCQSCLKAGRSEVAKEVDHIVPIHLNGTDELTNLQSLCSPCHRTKSALEGQRSRFRKEAAPQGKLIYHQRPSWFRRSVIPVTVVCGPPGAGKSTYVAKHAGKHDLVICFDQIATKLFGRRGGKRVHGTMTREQLGTVLRVRNEMIADLMYEAAAKRWPRAWLIVSEPVAAHRQWWHDKLGADIVVLLADAQECLRRVKLDANAGDERGASIPSVISKWFERYEQRAGDQVITN